MQKTLYVGLDVHKANISVTTAEEGRNGPISSSARSRNPPAAVAMLAKRLAKDGYRLEFCYEAGGCGYGIYRHSPTSATAAPWSPTSMIPRKPGERI